MPRLIDAEPLADYFRSLAVSLANARCFSAADAIQGAAERTLACPTIDAEPVRRGRWIPVKVCSVETKFKCSECNRTIIVCNDYFGRATEWASSEYPYCHCGAKMMEAQDD